jgi:hypothetical protein
MWQLNQANWIAFVMVDAAGAEVAGLGAGLTLELAKVSLAFAAGVGVLAEIGSGWYAYQATAAEADTPGPVAIRVNGAGCVQQNLEYVVVSRVAGAIAFTYTVTDVSTGLPLEGVAVWFSTDVGGVNVVWAGTTDAFGVARDNDGQLPRLDAGTYSVWRQKAGYTFVDPDTEVVS